MTKKSRMTRQKDVIEHELDALDSLFSADELFAKVEKKGIGIATVYRFLKDMRKRGGIHSYLCDHKTLYSRHETVHAHFHCQICKQTTHIAVDSVDFVRRKIQGDICHLQIDVSGTCPRCIKRSG